MTDQPSQQPPDETRDAVPAAPSPHPPADAGPTPEATTASAVKPSAPAPETWAPTSQPTAGTTEPGPTTYAEAPPSRLATVFPDDRPERAVGAAFGGGLVLALILRRLAH